MIIGLRPITKRFTCESSHYICIQITAIREHTVEHFREVSNRNLVCPIISIDYSCITTKRHFTYEVAIGMNGGIWFRLHDDNIINTIVIRNAILNSQYFDDDIKVIAMIEQLIKASKNIK